MNNLTKRLILAGVFIPALLVIILFMPWMNNLVINAVILFFSFWGGRETARILNNRGFKLHLLGSGIVSFLPGIAVYLTLVFNIQVELLLPVIILTSAAILLREGFLHKREDLMGVINRFTGYLTVLIYPGLFVSYMIKISSFDMYPPIILTFLALVFSNDSFAYIFGVLFGKNNRGLFKVSPNKSVAGFIGGLSGSIGAAFLMAWIFPDLFGGRVVITLFTGLLIGLLAVAGDLIESALKRSGEVKDSGTILMGRGGVMDSIDSLLFCAPFYYYLMDYLH
ncbi:MAG: phosphatidate cytidylyltransferase [Spirochaetales bacterium]|nr:phosphatidate cytidylyltransferase [Spirochaetales bacterium]